MNNRNHVCTACRTVCRTWGTLCRVCGREMRRVNRVPSRGDDAAWERLSEELRERDEHESAWSWRNFVATCPVR